MTTRGRSPRVVLTERLRKAKALLDADLHTLANYTGRVYIPRAERDPADPGMYLRARRDDEKLENLPAPWRSLADDFDSLSAFFTREARNARHIADTIERTGVCPTYHTRQES